MYLNTDTYNTYRCTVVGTASAAKWVYMNNIKDKNDDTSNAEADAMTIAIANSNGPIFKSISIISILSLLYSIKQTFI